MIYQKTKYTQEDQEDSKFPVKQVEMIKPIEDEEEPRFVGHVSLMAQTPMGNQQLPLSFEINAESLKDAFDRFAEHANPEIQKMRNQVEQEVQKLRKQNSPDSNRIVSPGDMEMKNQGNVVDFDNLKWYFHCPWQTGIRKTGLTAKLNQL